MINFSFWCENCEEFFPSARTVFEWKRLPGSSREERLCPKCGQPFGAITCYWMLVVNHHYSREYVRQRCVGLDTLEKMCYNCDNRFKCYTESL